MKKHFAVLGAGSVGCLWTAKLCQAGIMPTLILRPQRYKQLGQRVATISINNVDGSCFDYRVNLATSQTIKSAVDILIVCTKAQDTESAVESVQHALHAESIILLLQNGMGSQQAIASLLPLQPVWVGSMTGGAYLQAPFDVRHAGNRVTWIGKFSGIKSPAEAIFLDSLKKLQLDIQVTSDIEQMLWNKLGINCCINGLTAFYSCRNGELLDNGQRQQHLHRLIAETQQALDCLDKGKSYSLIKEVESVCKMTAQNISSTYHDVLMGRTTELACINGFLIQAVSAWSLELKEHIQLLSSLQKRGIEI
ncbi:MAG: ketopantoate reductase family protein [Endozoicomonas sp. (ex Botrylloides leachii)]|nr:ketopantoate reductase family protein [Endozoicomonas sp. (ex Botrylloides leachii)]